MKFLKILVLFSFCSACSTLTTSQNDTLWSLGSQVASIGANALGVDVTPAQLDGAAALIRTLAGAKNAPHPTDIKIAIVSGTGSSTAADSIAALVPVIQKALAKGASTDAVIETTSMQLNAVAAGARK